MRVFALYDDGHFGQLAALGVMLVVVITALGATAYRLGTRAQG